MGQAIKSQLCFKLEKASTKTRKQRVMKQIVDGCQYQNGHD